MSTMHGIRIFFGQHYISTCDLIFSYNFRGYFRKVMILGKKYKTLYTWFDFLYKLERNIPSSAKNSARYRTYIYLRNIYASGLQLTVSDADTFF